jgi:hypothetical protein
MGRKARLSLSIAALAVLVQIASATGARPGPAISVPRPFPLTLWTADSNNLAAASGMITLNGSPVSGVRVRVDGYELRAPTDASGHFVYFVDDTRLARHLVSVVDASAARTGDTLLSDAEQSAVAAARSAITVAYHVHDLHVSRDGSGHPVVSGRISYADGTAPPVVSLYSYQLIGTVTDAAGKPVVGARVSTRTLDRDYWTVSSPTDARGRYSSLFTASDEAGHDPAPMTVRVAKGDLVYQFLPEEFVNFQRLRSARMDVRLPPQGYPMVMPLPRSYPGAIYEGIVVGVAQGDTPARPVATTWPDARGRFRIVLPSSLAGRTVSVWEGKLDLFSHAQASPGSGIDLRDWPSVLPRDAPRGLANVTLHR